MGAEKTTKGHGGALRLSRNNIFEIMEKNSNIQKEAERIDSLFDKNELAYSDSPFEEGLYTIKNYVSKFCFHKWKSRGHCIDFDDFLATVDYDDFYSKARTGNVEAFLVFIEIVFNCWKMAEVDIKDNKYASYYPDFFFLQGIMTDCLSHYNHKAVYDESAERVLVIEDNPAITAVAEIVEPQLSLDVLKYNHHTLRGKIDRKKSYKHKSFAQENEIRMIVFSQVIDFHSGDGVFRVEHECLNNQIRKVLKVDLEKMHNHEGVSLDSLFAGVMLGPKSPQQLNALKGFLKENGFNQLAENIYLSECPLR